MKIGVKIAIIIVIILAIVVGAVGALFIFLNKEKDPMLGEEYKNIMEGKGYQVVDATSQYADYSYIEEVYLATPEDYSFQIEFYALADEEYAISFFDNNRTIFESSKDGRDVETSLELKNSSKYTLSSNGKYNVVSRIGNTVIYASVYTENADTVKEILNELGY